MAKVLSPLKGLKVFVSSQWLLNFAVASLLCEVSSVNCRHFGELVSWCAQCAWRVLVETELRTCGEQHQLLSAF